MPPPTKSCSTPAATNQAFEAVMNEDFRRLTSLLQRPDARQILDPCRENGNHNDNNDMTLLRTAAAKPYSDSSSNNKNNNSVKEGFQIIFDAIIRVGGIKFFRNQLERFDSRDPLYKNVLETLCCNPTIDHTKLLPLFFKMMKTAGEKGNDDDYLKLHLRDKSRRSLVFLVQSNADKPSNAIKFYLDTVFDVCGKEAAGEALLGIDNTVTTAFRSAVLRYGRTDVLQLFWEIFGKIDDGRKDGPTMRRHHLGGGFPILHSLCTNRHLLFNMDPLMKILRGFGDETVRTELQRKWGGNPDFDDKLLNFLLNKPEDEFTRKTAIDYFIGIFEEFGVLEDQLGYLRNEADRDQFNRLTDGKFARFFAEKKDAQDSRKKRDVVPVTKKKQTASKAKTAKKAAPKKTMATKKQEKKPAVAANKKAKKK